MTPSAFVERLGRVRATAILRTSLADAAAPAMEAAIRGGFRLVEFTLSVPKAIEQIEAFARRDDLVVGAGTVLTTAEAKDAVRAGARFLVSPIVDEAIIDEARALGVAMLPGCHTPTEMMRAHRAGATLQKLFPVPASGPDYVRACLGPMPFLKIVPTSGVDASNAAAWLAAGCYAVGFVGSLFDPTALAQGRFDLIEERARQCVAAVGSGSKISQ
ncbi:MAG TPA: bifunctional 4-hydroxy-2-oxoglutarate aldolase/2-dehydro-3-deoxy-phosphogluconate aldolase [Candidatus Polarisedimenticolaceae bacterium]|nr:bifunctional 4-hydroxy-2-oxoglutarate aldolase/2-dehydro-3-deoxy-phosphogluconate aldolase [Candidatus Polarisedimenticolaceae bacterium]